jgi:hypothetical protein
MVTARSLRSRRPRRPRRPAVVSRAIRIACALAALAATASADPPPRLAAGLDYTVGHGGQVEALDLGWRLEAGGFARVERWQLTLSVPWHPTIRSARPARDGETMTGVGLAGRLAYRIPLAGSGVLSLGAGMTRRWVMSSELVERGCRETRTCVAGTYRETPSYSAWAPQLRASVGIERVPQDVVVGMTFDLILEAIGLNDVPPDGIRAVTLMAGVTFTIGPARLGAPRAHHASTEPVARGPT